MQPKDEGPRLVEAGRGLSVLNTVEYRGRFLYSRYNPRAAVVSAVQKAQILPGTLILVCSPVLWYGLEELLEKSQGCVILALEAEPRLMALAKKNLIALSPDLQIELLDANDFTTLDFRLRSIADTGKVRRSMRIDFSAGVQFASGTYSKIQDAAQDIIGRFWKNRLTLTKMGRLYSRNLFRNLREFSAERQLGTVAGSVKKPVVVCGAGESIDALFDARNQKFLHEVEKKEYFVLAVDAALLALMARGIRPDAVVLVESQAAILKAFVGTGGTGVPVFADLVSRPDAAKATGGSIIWFLSEFTRAQFLERLCESAKITGRVMPMGSVGLTAVQVALTLRASDEVPVYVAGLDFSYTAGATHAKESYPHKARLRGTMRTVPIENHGAAFAEGTTQVMGKGSKILRTSTALGIYAKLFNSIFSGTKNLFDAGKCGIPLALEQRQPEPGRFCAGAEPQQFTLPRPNGQNTPDARIFLSEEKATLEKAKDLLVNGENSKFRENGKTLYGQVEELLKPREYLYLHFPDGYEFSMESQFLKRIRAEIDFFLKQLG